MKKEINKKLVFSVFAVLILTSALGFVSASKNFEINSSAGSLFFVNGNACVGGMQESYINKIPVSFI